MAACAGIGRRCADRALRVSFHEDCETEEPVEDKWKELKKCEQYKKLWENISIGREEIRRCLVT